MHETTAQSLCLSVVIAACSLVVVGLWGVFGLFNGFNAELFLIYTSEIAHGLDGFFYDDPLRKFESLFYHLSYILGTAVGDRGSFVPYQLVYGSLWVLRSVLTFLIVKRLMPDRPALALFAGLLAALHAADKSLNWVGQLNQFGFIFLMLLSFFLLLLALDGRSKISTVTWAAASAVAAYVSLWSYESPLPVMLAFPFAVAVLRREVPLSRFFCVSGIYLVPVLVFIVENIRRYLGSAGDGGLTYQAGVSRHNFSPATFASDLWFHLENSLIFWKWPQAFFRSDRLWDYAIALPPVLVAIFLLVPTAISAENRSTRSFRLDLRLLIFACLSFGLLVASYLVILILEDNRELWRTEFLPSFAAACLGGAALYALLSLAYATAQRLILAMGVMTAVGIFSIMAGVNSGLQFHDLWEGQRVVMSSIISNAPRVADGTLFVIRNMDRQSDPFGDNGWFDLAMRLAYPETKVAGIYFFADGSPALSSSIDIKGGRPRLLLERDGDIPTLFHLEPQPPISHVLIFDYDPATEEVDPLPAGPVKIGDEEIPAGGYEFCPGVMGSKPAAIAVRRYGPIGAARRIACAQDGRRVPGNSRF